MNVPSSGEAPQHPSPPLLAMDGIVKRFSGVVALDGVSLDLRHGECHALVGENGAGKSTLIKVLSGAYVAEAGTIRLDGELENEPTPRRMRDLGVAVIYQEMSLAPHLSVAENVFLGRLPRTRWGTIDWRAARRETNELLARLGVRLDPTLLVGDLSIAHQQMVEIAKALSLDSRVLVLDEPSAVLGDAEVARLFEIVRTLKRQGISFIYISHRLKEVFEIADRVTVLRDGRTITTADVESIDSDDLVRHMVGRELRDIYPPKDRVAGEVLLRATNLVRGRAVKDVSIEVRAGEIVGIAGLAGSGRTEMLRLLSGADRLDQGDVQIGGVPVSLSGPRKALSVGVGLVPEDRKRQGLFLQHSVGFNVSSASLTKLSTRGVLRLAEEKASVQQLIAKLRIKTPSERTVINGLSGGNQQKAVIARWLLSGIQVLLADEPTRGVDVGAKQEIYRLLDELARAGMAVVFVSSELPEVIGLADRVLVMRGGRVSGELSGSPTEEQIMSLAVDAGGSALSGDAA